MPLRFLKTWKLDDIEKRPLVVMVALLISILFFTITRKDTREDDCKSETKEWQTRYVNLTVDLLEKNKIIERQGEKLQEYESSETDSAVREEVETPVTNILK